jgi:hypothetical protein
MAPARAALSFAVDTINASTQQGVGAAKDSTGRTPDEVVRWYRARVRDSNGQMAWTQPVFVRGG